MSVLDSLLSFLHLEDLTILLKYTIILACLILGFIYLNDYWSSDGSSEPAFSANSYGYSSFNGPSLWKQRFSSAGGCKQSPINLQDEPAIVCAPQAALPLKFSTDFHCLPCQMKLFNNGHNVVIYASWKNEKKPTIVGGPLAEDYHFVNLRFRWGPNDYEGSEHMINSSKYAMELQAAFVKSTSTSDDILKAAKFKGLLMLSYFFSVTPVDNPYLEPIISSLRFIRVPMGCIFIEPVILSLLMPEFCRDYFSYVGSLTFPPCTEGVLWIVKPEPLMISSRQVKKFRKLVGCDGLIGSNTRPVQKINDRDVFYYS